MEVLFDLADRMGLRAEVNLVLNQTFGFEGDQCLGAGEKIGWHELGDRVLKRWFGSDHDLSWFLANGFIRWPKKVEEAYWRWFVDARVPLYLEWIIDLGGKIRGLAEGVGIRADWEQYTPYISWFPTPVHQKDGDSEYDLYCFSYRDVMHTGSMTNELPWVDEASEMNPYTYRITMNAETAGKKGLKDGDEVWLETPEGRKQKGRLKLMEGQHPRTIAIAACSGHWARGLPVAKGKGTNFDDLLPIDLAHTDPVSGNLETCVRVKVYRV
jgi:anaerobic selenocysteine-containing dehydrogenase